MKPIADITELVKQSAAEAGFDLAGVAPVQDFPELKYFSDWIAEHRAGEMHYLEERDEAGELKRASLARVAPWARSVIICAMNYNTRSPLSVPHAPRDDTNRAKPAAYPSAKQATGNGPNGTGKGLISRYAWSHRDYHDILMEALRRVESRIRADAGEEIETRCYVDTEPLVERVYARYAGLGWIGKNTCIIHQREGSYIFLGAILTSLELVPDIPAPDRCGSCTRCLDACPTSAFVGPHQLDANRCISYLTIEKRGAIPEDLRAGIGQHVFGCDICQDVCPWNRKVSTTAHPEFHPRPELVNPELSWLATISQEEFSRVFRSSPLKRAKRSGMRRNAVVAMGNSGDPGFLPLLRELANDPDENVAEHARWAKRKLQDLER